MRILLTGRHGQVGSELAQVLPALGEVIATDRTALDLYYSDLIRQAVRNARPDIIVNAAAYTAVDQAESETDIAMEVNGVAPGVLAEEAKRLGALLVHYSTDYVFDGDKRSAYVEADAPNPLNAYGRTKLEGERRIAQSGCRHLILRTSWVYSDRRENFALTMRRLALEKPELRVVDDQTGTPTWARTLAQAVAQVCALASSRAELGEGAPVYHATCAGETTRFGWVQAIVASLPGAATKLTPVASADFPAAARRPLYSVLSCEKLRRDFGVRLPDWRVAFEAFQREWKPA